MGVPQGLAALGQLTDTRPCSVWAKDDLTAVVWRDKQDVHILTNMHHSPTNCNFCDEHGNGIKQIIMQYNKHMGHIDRGTGC